ncbi:MAG: hypothetical protein DRP85_00685 [Candidatus Makaraimicrobium thalassicum]|nr:MAG: hypothetical protein DRP85_00685 [Candidatus Omnitrophota bacterium]
MLIINLNDYVLTSAGYSDLGSLNSWNYILSSNAEECDITYKEDVVDKFFVIKTANNFEFCGLPGQIWKLHSGTSKPTEYLIRGDKLVISSNPFPFNRYERIDSPLLKYCGNDFAFLSALATVGQVKHGAFTWRAYRATEEYLSLFHKLYEVLKRYEIDFSLFFSATGLPRIVVNDSRAVRLFHDFSLQVPRQFFHSPLDIVYRYLGIIFSINVSFGHGHSHVWRRVLLKRNLSFLQSLRMLLCCLGIYSRIVANRFLVINAEFIHKMRSFVFMFKSAERKYYKLYKSIHPSRFRDYLRIISVQYVTKPSRKYVIDTEQDLIVNGVIVSGGASGR